jgi:hypothetical protein
MRIPAGLVESSVNSPTGCRLHIIGPGGLGACAKSWRGWVVGSSTTFHQHLVITASPTALRNAARLVNGPTWYPAARVIPLTWVKANDSQINGWRMHAVFVPPSFNDGSAFASHVVLVWTVAGHTYGVGFHDVSGIDEAIQLDLQLLRTMRLVRP